MYYQQEVVSNCDHFICWTQYALIKHLLFCLHQYIQTTAILGFFIADFSVLVRTINSNFEYMYVYIDHFQVYVILTKKTLISHYDYWL